MTDLTICIVTYKNDRTLARTLQALFDFAPPSVAMRIYVVDNASSAYSREQIAPFLDRITYVPSDKGNIGFGSANNLILPELDSRYHIIMNPDVYLKDDSSILTLMRYLDEHKDVGMAVPGIVDEQGTVQYLCRRNLTVLDLFLRFSPVKIGSKRQDYHAMMDKDYTTSFDVEFASGCFLMIRTDLFRQLGGFDEKYFLYAEDADLTRRVNEISRTVYVPQAVVCHAWERASYRDPAMTRIHLRSLWHYFRKWGFRLK